EPLPLHGRQAGPPALVPLGLPHPLPERLRGTADLLGDRRDRRPLRIMRSFVLHHHPHRPLTHFRGEPAWSCHGSILSRSGASWKSGAVQFPVNSVTYVPVAHVFVTDRTRTAPRSASRTRRCTSPRA